MAREKTAARKISAAVYFYRAGDGKIQPGGGMGKARMNGRRRVTADAILLDDGARLGHAGTQGEGDGLAGIARRRFFTRRLTLAPKAKNRRGDRRLPRRRASSPNPDRDKS